jgi:hypothetical protein
MNPKIASTQPIFRVLKESGYIIVAGLITAYIPSAWPDLIVGLGIAVWRATTIPASASKRPRFDHCDRQPGFPCRYGHSHASIAATQDHYVEVLGVHAHRSFCVSQDAGKKSSLSNRILFEIQNHRQNSPKSQRGLKTVSRPSSLTACL